MGNRKVHIERQPSKFNSWSDVSRSICGVEIARKMGKELVEHYYDSSIEPHEDRSKSIEYNGYTIRVKVEVVGGNNQLKIHIESEDVAKECLRQQAKSAQKAASDAAREARKAKMIVELDALRLEGTMGRKTEGPDLS